MQTKYKTPDELWDRCPRKLIVYVMEGISMVTKKGVGNPYVKIIYDKQKAKTSSFKNTEDATWKEMFFFEVMEEPHELIIEVYNKQSLNDKLIGQCVVCIPNQLQTEKVIDQWFDLDLPENLKTKYKDVLDEIIGNVHLRLYYSVEKETPSPDNSKNKFMYRNCKEKMKTGDLILYDGIGCMDSVTKIYSGSQYSRIGIILKMPNRHTKKMSLFIAEMSRNIGNFLDAFKQKGNAGLNLYRLKERIHFVHATSIWWSPLKTPIESLAGEQNMLDWMKGVSSKSIKIDDLPTLPEEILDFFNSLEIQLSKIMCSTEEMNSAYFAIQALRLSGKRYPFDHQYISPVKALVNDYFEQPIILREKVDGTSAETGTISQSKAERRFTILKNKEPEQSNDKLEHCRNRSNTNMVSSSKRKLDRQRHKSSSNLLGHKKVTSNDTELERREFMYDNDQEVKHINRSHSRNFSERLETKNKNEIQEIVQKEVEPEQTPNIEINSKPVIRNLKIRPPSESVDPMRLEEMKAENGFNLSITSGGTKPEKGDIEIVTEPVPNNVKVSESIIVMEESSDKAVIKTKTEEEKSTDSPKKKKKKKKKDKSQDNDTPKKKIKSKKTYSHDKKQKSKQDEAIKGKVKWNFEAENDGEVTCKEGDILDIIDHTSDPDWLIVRLNGVHGCIPKSFVDII